MAKKRGLPASGIRAWWGLAALAFILCAYCAQAHMDRREVIAASDPAQAYDVRINEVMTDNELTLAGGRDWIELLNTGSQPANITGWMLLRNDEAEKAFTFGEKTLAPGERALVVASKSATGGDCAPYNLSASGVTLTLLNGEGARADHVEVPAMRANQVYARDEANGSWQVADEYTPLAANTREAYEAALPKVIPGAPVEITEIMADDASYFGCDWIELSNTSSEAINLSGYCLSDDAGQAGKWRIGDITLAPGECALFFADGLDEGTHASFKLDAQGEQVLLTDPSGSVLDRAQWSELPCDRSLSKRQGTWTRAYPPTPGYANDEAGLAAVERQLSEGNATGLYITEVMAANMSWKTTVYTQYDWVEIHNASWDAVSLEGIGLSDDPSAPRKWQFPVGARVEPGEYALVMLSGRTYAGKDGNGWYHAPFRLGADGAETLTLCDASGTIFDRVPLPEQTFDVSYGRVDGQSGYCFMTEATPGAQNARVGYAVRPEQVTFSAAGGQYDAPLSVELSAQENARIYYTLDCRDPDTASIPYTGPIAIERTTVLRAIAYVDGAMPSLCRTNTYFIGAEHTMRIVSLVSDPENLFGDERGILAYGPTASEDDPDGANFWQDWEREASVEIFDLDGQALVSENCGVRVHGASSRRRAQKSLKIIARNEYGAGWFDARLFSGRDQELYKSFVLRSGGQDGEITRMRDSVLCALLAKGTSVMYYETELCAVYLNGAYYGHYNMREVASKYSIAQFEGWEDPDAVSIVRGADLVRRGSDATYEALIAYMQAHPEATDEDLARVEQAVDLENYFDFVSAMIYAGNLDIGIRRYMNPNADGRWRWVLFDLDLAFYYDADTVQSWLESEGAGSRKADNRIFVYAMKNAAARERFLTRFGELVSQRFTSGQVAAAFEARYQQLLPEMAAHFQRWPALSERQWKKYSFTLIDYAMTRSAKVIEYTRVAFGLTEDEVVRYFGPNYERAGG